MEALATLAPAVAEIDILMDVRLIEIDQRMLLIPGAIQQRANLPNESLPPLGIGTPEQLPGFLPRQIQPPQRRADGFATAPATEPLSHKCHQALERQTRRRIGPGDRWFGRFLLSRADLFTQRGLDSPAKAGAGTGVLIPQRLGTMFIVSVQPIHHSLRVATWRIQVVVATPFERKLRCRVESGGRIGRGGRPYSHLVARRLQDAMSGGGSGWRLRPVWPVRMPRSRQGCRRR